MHSIARGNGSLTIPVSEPCSAAHERLTNTGDGYRFRLLAIAAFSGLGPLSH